MIFLSNESNTSLALMFRRLSLIGLFGIAIAACVSPVVRTPKEEVAKMPLVDVHTHLNATTHEGFLEVMQNAGISRMVLFIGREYPVFVMKQPNRFVPCLHGRIKGLQRRERNDGTNPEMVERIGDEWEEALKSGRFKCLGEFHTYAGGRRPSYVSPNSPLIRRAIEIAGRYKLPINIHCSANEANEMELALRAFPSTLVVWAHGGSGLSPLAIRDFLKNHPNLYFDLSAKFPIRRRHIYPILYGLTINEEWRQLFESYPDRFFVGFDFARIVPERLGMAKEIGDSFRQVLMQLTPATSRKIAYENAERVYKIQK